MDLPRECLDKFSPKQAHVFGKRYHCHRPWYIVVNGVHPYDVQQDDHCPEAGVPDLLDCRQMSISHDGQWKCPVVAGHGWNWPVWSMCGP